MTSVFLQVRLDSSRLPRKALLPLGDRQVVSHAMRALKNVKAEKSIFIRVLPLFLKNFVINFVYSLAGEKRMSSVLSNLGIIDVPSEMSPHIERFDAMVGAMRFNKVGCAVCSFGDKLSICFTSGIEETHIEKAFFTFLVKKGIHVKLETNRE